MGILKARKAEREARKRLEREKNWWRFQARMDFVCGEITFVEFRAVLAHIDEGEEYVGWARREWV
jgi:hypothetical protein